MKKLLFIANHQAPKELEAEYEVVALSDEQKKIWSNIPKENVANNIASIIEDARNYDLVVVVGEPRACHIVVCAIGKEKCFSTYSIRQSIDEPQADGSVIKKAVFKFDGLVAYE